VLSAETHKCLSLWGFTNLCSLQFVSIEKVITGVTYMVTKASKDCTH
jgi:hypothetical protein